MKKLSFLSLILSGTLILICGCRRTDFEPIMTERIPETEIGGYTVESTAQTSPETEADTEPMTLPIAIPDTDTQSEAPSDAVSFLYIGNNGSFRFYPYTESDIITPDALILAMADLTGWNLDLADTVSTGKGGMTVCFADTCSLFTGPPEPQKDEFHMYSAEQLCSTILDSIAHTLQYNFIDPSLGDPSNLDIYFCMGDNEPLYLPDLDLTIPMEEPYQGFPY